jgi:hypothetical protein
MVCWGRVLGSHVRFGRRRRDCAEFDGFAVAVLDTRGSKVRV